MFQSPVTKERNPCLVSSYRIIFLPGFNTTWNLFFLCMFWPKTLWNLLILSQNIVFIYNQNSVFRAEKRSFWRTYTSCIIRLKKCKALHFLLSVACTNFFLNWAIFSNFTYFYECIEMIFFSIYRFDRPTVGGQMNGGVKYLTQSHFLLALLPGLSCADWITVVFPLSTCSYSLFCHS